MDSEKKLEVLKKYLLHNHILIVDESISSREKLTKTLVDIGCVKEHIYVCSEVKDAITICQDTNAKMIISDYKLGKTTCFDLFQQLGQLYGDEAHFIFIMLTSDLTQAKVAQAAEEEVDSFILRPYTQNILKENLKSTVAKTLHPSSFINRVRESKKLMTNKEGFEEAKSILFEAIIQNPNPSLANYYTGKIEEELSQREEALRNFQEGLEKNFIHFKCMNGLYQNFLRNNEEEKAYKVGKDLVKYYPQNIKRFNEMIKLGIKLKSYGDFRFFYTIFELMHEKERVLRDHICSALFVSAKYYLYTGNEQDAFTFFENIGKSFAGHTKFIKAIIEVLVNFGHYEPAKKYLELFPADKREDMSYQLCELLVKHQELADPEKLEKATNLIKDGAKSFTLYKKVMRRLYIQGSDNRAENYFNEALILWKDYENEIRFIKKKYQNYKAKQAELNGEEVQDSIESEVKTSAA